MDKYLQNVNVENRLIEEWKQYKNLIIAFDYDGTVYDYHNEGIKFDDIITLLRRCREIGAYFIVFTSCEENKFHDIRKYCIDNDIPCDAINESPLFIPFKGRKIYYNILLDDRAGLQSAYESLNNVCEYIETYKEGE